MLFNKLKYIYPRDLVFSNIALLWLSANILTEHIPFVLSITPMLDSLDTTNSFKSSGDIYNGHSLLHSFAAVPNGQVIFLPLYTFFKSSNACLSCSSFGAFPCQPAWFSINDTPLPLIVFAMIAQGFVGIMIWKKSQSEETVGQETLA